jgi:glutamate synthase (NADPH/NADH) large chain
VVETASARGASFLRLAGYGAEAINPYLAFETLEQIRDGQGPAAEARPYEVQRTTIKAVGKGILKVMSKMGISTYQSYCGAQIFDAVGLSRRSSRNISPAPRRRSRASASSRDRRKAVRRHRDAYGDNPIYRNMLDVGGDYAFRLRGEAHAWTPESVVALQHAVRGNSPDKYQGLRPAHQRPEENAADPARPDGIKLRRPAGRSGADRGGRAGREIVKRFATGAMSFGSISREAHTTLAIAMNRIGGKSNTGEGGEESDRYKPLPNGDSMRSAIKQVASGRFGVTAEYLVNADDDADQDGAGRQARRRRPAARPQGRQEHRQGAPFDAGRRPDLAAAASRHLFDRGSGAADLRSEERQPQARISVKLVSEVGVGTVAAGVSKARADHVTIAGFEGGTGASPLTSIKHAGSPGRSAWPRRNRPWC